MSPNEIFDEVSARILASRPADKGTYVVGVLANSIVVMKKQRVPGTLIPLAELSGRDINEGLTSVKWQLIIDRIRIQHKKGLLK